MGGLRSFVLERDGHCLALDFDRDHVCVGYLTLEHVPGVHGPEDVRRDDERHCVALCLGINVRGPSKPLRINLRYRLRERYPVCRV